MAHRIEQGVTRGRSLALQIDGVDTSAYEGETLATALLASGCAAFHRTARSGAPRGPYCNMGTCFECRVQVQGRGWVLACMTPVEAGMQVTTGLVLPVSAESTNAD